MSEVAPLEFGVPLVVVLINGFLARAIAAIWLRADRPAIAAFAFVLGTLPMLRGTSLLTIAGAMTGLIALWWLLFKQETVRA